MAKRKPRHFVIFALFRLVSFFIYILPLSLALKIGGYLGRVFFYLLRRERVVALNNLDLAFGKSKSLKEKHSIARGVFENLGKSLVEVASLTKFNERNIDAYIECKGFEAIERFLLKGKGGIVLTGHFGNWELIAHYFAIKGYKVNVVARRVRMEQFERLLARSRRRHGVNILYRDASAKEVIELLKNNEFVGMMPDQDMVSISGVFVDFFGKLAYTPSGPAILNILTEAPIVLCFIVRKEFGHKILVGRPIDLSATGNREKDILENTQRYTKVIENYIREFPSHWVWFHERWKTRPQEENKVSER